MSSTNTARQPVPVARDAKRPMPDARGPLAGRTERE